MSFEEGYTPADDGGPLVVDATGELDLNGVYFDLSNIPNQQELYLGHAETVTGSASVSSGWRLVVQDVGSEGVFAQPVVPIPPTVWIFGSALLGLIGIRRRIKN
jgi:hypothetical protein